MDENRTKLSITFLYNFRFGLYKGKEGKRKGWGKTAGREGTFMGGVDRYRCSDSATDSD